MDRVAEGLYQSTPNLEKGKFNEPSHQPLIPFSLRIFSNHVHIEPPHQGTMVYKMFQDSQQDKKGTYTTSSLNP